MATDIDKLIAEIAIITGLSEDEVVDNYTQDQLDRLLSVSQCEGESSVAPIINDLDDIPCIDRGAPADQPSIDIEDIIDTIAENDKVHLDSSKCVEAVDVINQKVKEAID